MNRLQIGNKIFETDLSEVSFGKWKSEETSSWKDVIIKAIPQKKKYSNQDNDLRHCIESETIVLRLLEEKEPKSCLYKRLLDVIITDDKHILVLEKGEIDVLEYFLQWPDISEKRSTKVAQCLFSMVECLTMLHKYDISHNDVKPENFVFQPNMEDVAIIDFGVSSCFKIPFSFRTFGTKVYTHPLMFTSANLSTNINDLFALGMCLFVLFAGCIPYDKEASLHEMFTIRYTFTNGSWMKNIHITDCVVKQSNYNNWCDLVSKLCSGKEWKKASMSILDHPFFDGIQNMREQKVAKRNKLN